MKLTPAADDAKGRRIAKAIREALEVRAGEVLTPQVIEDRANNGACHVLEALYELEHEETTPVGYETMQEHAERVIK